MLAFLWGQQQWFSGNIQNIAHSGCWSGPLGIKALNLCNGWRGTRGGTVGDLGRRDLWRHLLGGQNLAAGPEEGRDQRPSQTGLKGLAVSYPSSGQSEAVSQQRPQWFLPLRVSCFSAFSFDKQIWGI